MVRISLTYSGSYVWLAAQFAVAVFGSMVFGKTEVPVFLFSGQSNMVGMGSINDLPADQKKTISNVMINVSGDCDAAKKGKWLALGPGFGNTATNFGPELLFGKTLCDSLPNQKFAFIKSAVNGAPLGTSGGYLPPGSNNGTGGTHYKSMITHIEAALKTFTTAFDTSEYTPRWAGFVWLQGESDAMQGGSMASSYQTNLENLIDDIRTLVETDDLPVILPLITTSSLWVESAKIRAADIAMRAKLENVDTVDTKGYTLPDNMHYNAAGQVKIGSLAAQRWLDLEYDYHAPVSVAVQNRHSASGAFVSPSKVLSTEIFDVAGRHLQTHRNVAQLNGAAPAVLVGKTRSATKVTVIKKAVVR